MKRRIATWCVARDRFATIFNFDTNKCHPGRAKELLAVRASFFAEMVKENDGLGDISLISLNSPRGLAHKVCFFLTNHF